MPMYLFKDEFGAKHELHFSSEDAPRIGDKILKKQHILVRVPSFHIDTAGISRKTHKYPYVSHQLCRKIEGAESNKKGKPVIRSQSHEREIMARHDLEKH